MSGDRVYGLVLGEVIDIDDPEGQGRLKLRLLARSSDAESQWAPVARPLASGGFGLWFPPVTGDVVVVGFEDGRIERPYVLGAIFTGDNQPPTTEGQERVIRTESGHSLSFIDTPGSEAVKIEDQAGNTITMDATGITIESKTDLTLKGVNVSIEAQAQLTAKGTPIHLNP
jgi:uncharacterized protein involved in type VI secretion and phage assembly